MIRVLFVCHGNICRSPMAEFLFKHYVKSINREHQFYIESAGTSDEEEGNEVFPDTKEILDRYNIDCSNKKARKIRIDDYNKFDYIIGMDHANRISLLRFFNYDPDHKVKLLLDFTPSPGDIVEPWYYDNFESTRKQIMFGLECFFSHLIDTGELS